MTDRTARAEHPRPGLQPHVQRWVTTGAALVVVGYLTSIGTRLAIGELQWIGTEVGAVAGGLCGLGLALRGRVRAAGVLVLGTVWAELHVSMLPAIAPSVAFLGGMPVFPLLIVATGLFFGGGAAMGVAAVTAVTVPLFVAWAYAINHVSTSVAPFPVQPLAVLAVTMLAAATLVWLGMRSFESLRQARETEARKYALLVDHAPYGVVLLSQAGRIEALNPAAEALLKAPGAGLIGRAFTEVLGAAGPLVEAIVEPAGQEGRRQTELTLGDADGRRYVEASGSRTALDDGTTGALIVLRDVTERREMERHAIQLGRMLDQAPYEIYVFDGDSLRIRFANASARRNLGYGAHEMEALTVTDVMPALTRGDVRRLITDLSSQPNEVVALVAQNRRADGSSYPVEARLHLVSYTGESSVGLFAIDVSERAAAEEEQDRLRVRMQAAQRFEAVQQLAGGISHEFNNLLMSVGGYAEMIAEFASEERVRDWAGRIRVAQQRGAGLIRQLQGLARTEVAQPAPMALGEALREFLPVLERTLGPTMRVELQAAGPDVVLMDRAQLEQVVLHLASNARDAMPGGGTITIAVRGPAGEADGEVELDVRDTGRGMSPEVAARAFDPFFTGKSRGEGTGLGLTTVRSILTQVHGHIELDSTPGVGTVARVRLPQSREPPPTRRRTPEGMAVELVAGASGDILLVEDDADARAVVAHALTRAGYQVRAAGTAEEGLAWLTERQGDVDLVLTDIALPGMTGFALGVEVNARFAPLRVLYMSGYAQEHIAGAPAGFDPVADLLVKPFSTEKLLAAVRFTLERAGQRGSGPDPRPDV